MYKFIQKNQKKFLAVFAVGLMVVFILPPLTGQTDPAQAVAFRLGDEKVTVTEARRAAEDWEAMTRGLELQGIHFVLDGMQRRVPEELVLGIERDKVLFLLLQKEAQRLGLRVSQDEVNQYAPQGGPDAPSIRRGIEGLLLVRALIDRVGDGVKPSEPRLTRELARNLQRVKLDLVHYSTDDFAQDLPARTAEQLQKQFDGHKGTLAGEPTDVNPFGFGYMVPKQVKLLYVTVPHDEVTKVVKAKKSDFDWKVEAMLHYRRNPSKYPVTQEAETQPSETQPSETQPSETQPSETQPADTQPPSSQPSTAPAATRPTTRPFEEVQEQIVEEMARPEVDRKADEIAAMVADRMRADFEARQRKSAGASEDFGSLAHLQRIKADVQKKHGVEIAVAEINEPKGVEGLRELKGIGTSSAGSQTFPEYVMEWAEPFVAKDKKESADVLSIGEPSKRFRDFDGNVYVFQLRGATAAHPPADLAAVKDKVEADLRTKLAFEAALAAATKLEAAARPEGLEAAAKSAGKDVFTTPEFLNRPDPENRFNMPPDVVLPHVDLPMAAREKLVRQAFELLDKATPDKPNPTTVAPLETAGRVVVAELGDVERAWRDEQQELARQQAGMQLTSRHARRILADYFKAAAVKQRLGYKSPTGEPPTETAAAD